MGNVTHIAAALGLVALLLATGIVLRTMAAVVQQYGSRFGSPRLATSLRIIALLMLGVGAWLLCLAGLAGIISEANVEERVLATAAAVVSIYLLFAGLFVLRWGWVIASTQRSNVVETKLSPFQFFIRVIVLGPFLGPFYSAFAPIQTLEGGTLMAIGLAWLAGWWAVLICAMTFFAPVITVGLLPLLLFILCGLLPIELVMGWGRRGQRQLWELWQVCLTLRGHRPVADELAILSDYSWGAQRRRMLEMADELHDGATAEEVFIRPTFLSTIEGSQVATGMKSGRLPEVLQELLARRTMHTKEMLGFQDRLYSGLHLCFTLLILALVSQFIMHWIVPKLRRIFDDFGMELPAMTQVVFSQNDLQSAGSHLVLLSIAVVAAAAVAAAALPILASFPRVRDQLARFWPRLCLPEILRTMSFAVSARTSLEETLVPFVRRQFQIPLHSRLVRVQEAVREGADCWSEMAVEKLLTAKEAALLQSAQRAGNLPWALRAIGQRCEQRWRFRLAFCLEFVQPVLILCVGILVMFFVMSLFLPLVKLINDLA